MMVSGEAIFNIKFRTVSRISSSFQSARPVKFSERKSLFLLCLFIVNRHLCLSHLIFSYVASGSSKTEGYRCKGSLTGMSFSRCRDADTKFTQVTFPNNTLCVSVARVDAAMPRIEPFFPCRDGSHASKAPFPTRQQAVSHNLKYSECLLPKNIKEDSFKTYLVSLVFPPVVGIDSRRNYVRVLNRNKAGDRKDDISSGNDANLDVWHESLNGLQLSPIRIVNSLL